MEITINIPSASEMRTKANSFKNTQLFADAINKTLKFYIKKIKENSNEGKRYIWVTITPLSSVENYYKELKIDRDVFKEAVWGEVVDTLTSAGYRVNERRPYCVSLVW